MPHRAISSAPYGTHTACNDYLASVRGVASRKQVRGPQHNMLTIANVNQDIETIGQR